MFPPEELWTHIKSSALGVRIRTDDPVGLADFLIRDRMKRDDAELYEYDIEIAGDFVIIRASTVPQPFKPMEDFDV